MYDAIADFIRSFSADHTLLWALLVMGVVASVSLVLYGFWELVLRLLSGVGFSNRNSGPRAG